MIQTGGGLRQTLPGTASPSSLIAREQVDEYLLQLGVHSHCEVRLQSVAAVGTAKDLCFEGALQTGLEREGR